MQVKTENSDGHGKSKVTFRHKRKIRKLADKSILESREWSVQEETSVNPRHIGGRYFNQ